MDVDELNLVFYAESPESRPLLRLIEDEGPEAVIDRVVGGHMENTEDDDPPEPDDADDEIFEHDDGYILVYNDRLRRVWLFEHDVPDEDLVEYQTDSPEE